MTQLQLDNILHTHTKMLGGDNILFSPLPKEQRGVLVKSIEL